jgi:hypothetical protein
MPAGPGEPQPLRKVVRRLAPGNVDLLVVGAMLFGALLAACSGDGRPEQANATGCPSVHPKWGASKALREFFPPSRVGLWLRNDRCVYLVRRGSADARLLWSGRRRELVRGVVWAPDGESLAITTKSSRDGWRGLILRPDGGLLRRLRATGVAFLRDGRLAVSRRNGIYPRGESRRLASRAELERVAGFRARAVVAVSPDPWGYWRGYGRDRLALTLWSRTGSKSVVLVVSASRHVTRASPAYRAGGGEGVVSGWAWSPEGQRLFVMSEVVPPKWRGPGDHDHCLDIWSAEHGIRRAFCGSGLRRSLQLHFSRLVWAANGRRGLLDNGTVVTRNGRVAGRADAPASDFDVQWQPAGA